MRIRRSVFGAILLGVAFVLLPSIGMAQTAPSGIAGLVKDTSGGALPGVTVEAASPALIEKVRSVITDGEGRFNIVDLRPGTYSVTFTLPGFSTFKRDGVTLTVGFTATVNADMQVGSLEETITVTGEAPLVDTQNVRQQKVISTETLTTLPTGSTSITSIIALTPGYTGNATVGGSMGAYYSQQTKGAFHGKKGSHILFDGMRIDNYAGSGDSPGYIFNQKSVEETALESGGAGAESDAPNVNINMIPKEGGNTFRYNVDGLYTGSGLQSDNMDDNLVARGLQSVPTVKRQWDVSFNVGGPIRKDKLWFFTSIRRWGVENTAAGLFWNATQGGMFYTPDLSRPATRLEKTASHFLRTTWQINPKNKMNFVFDLKSDCVCLTGGSSSGLGSGAANSQEGVESWHLWPNGIVQGTWNSPRTSKLLLEAGGSLVMFHWPGYLAPGVTGDEVSIVEQSTSMRYNNPGSLPPDRRMGDRYSQRFALSYITGSHTFKTGIQQNEGYSDTVTIGLGLPGNKGVSYRFNNGVPNQLTMASYPRQNRYFQLAEMGIYAQDQWALKRLTMNGGLRFDYYRGYVPAIDIPASNFLPASHYDAVHDAPVWKAMNPRGGISYDIFGNGRTAAKLSVGRYVAMTGNGQVSAYVPQSRAISSVTRSWNDANKNYSPDCNLNNFAKNGECGAISNTNFGNNDPNARTFADDVRFGWSAWAPTWDISTEVQHQITQGVSINGGYYHNWDSGFQVTDNTLVTAANYGTYCVTAPLDPRLPKGGGYQICGLADVNPDKFGLSQQNVTLASNFGKQVRYNDFFGVNIDTRFPRGIRFSGGVDTGRTVTDSCFVVDSPGYTNDTTPGLTTTIDGVPFCHNVTPLAGNTQVKLNGSYPLPYGFVMSATYQNHPGASYTASWAAPNASIKPSLGRDLSGGNATATVPLITSNSLREPRRTQVDLRFGKSFNIKNRRLQANFDVYNALNSNAVLGNNTTFGSKWLTPTLILNGRLIQFSGNYSF